MTDPITEVAETAVTSAAGIFSGFSTTIIIALVTFVIGLGCGAYLYHLYVQAGITAQAVQGLKNQQTADKIQFNAEIKESKINTQRDNKDQILDEKVNAAIIKTPVPKCLIPADRVQFINTAAHRK